MNDYSETLIETFCDTAEKLAFMFGEVAEEPDLPSTPVDPVQVSMTFMGPQNGRLVLATTRGMCGELAANMLGTDADDPNAEARALDAAKELLNVTCGNVLTAIAGEEAVFDLTVPELRALDMDGWEGLLRAAGTVYLMLDDHPVMLNLSMMK